MSPTLRFIPAMYAAALSGRKTQTRRVITPQPSFHFSPTIGLFHPALVDRRTGEAYPGPETWGCYDDTEHYFPTYGPPGTTLPIVTTWAIAREWDTLQPCIMDPEVITAEYPIWFNDDTEKPDWAGKSRPAMFFPKSLYHLARHARVTAVKAERVMQISEVDAIAEGAQRNDAPGEEWDGTYLTQRYINGIEGSQDDEPHGSAKEWYREIWDSINAERGKGENKGCYAWDKNPWVFATTFELV